MSNGLPGRTCISSKFSGLDTTENIVTHIYMVIYACAQVPQQSNISLLYFRAFLRQKGRSCDLLLVLFVASKVPQSHSPRQTHLTYILIQILNLDLTLTIAPTNCWCKFCHQRKDSIICHLVLPTRQSALIGYNTWFCQPIREYYQCFCLKHETLQFRNSCK